MADFEYDASLDLNQVEKSLDSIDRQMDRFTSEALKSFKRLEKQGGSSFSQVGREARLSGTQIGFTSGVTQELTSRLVELGAAGVRAFVDVAKQSVQAASQFDTTEKRLIGIFQGSEEAANATFDRIRERSIELGIDLTELAGAFLPRVESVDQFERIAEVASALARSDPGQGELGARIALQELLSGDTVSIRRRFEFSSDEIASIEAAQEKFGDVEGAIIGVQQVLKDTGRDFETLADTFETSLGRGQQIALELQSVFGEPILDELKEILDDLFEAFQENREDIESVASIFGEVAGKVIEIVGSGLFEKLQNIELESVGELATNMGDVAISATTFASQIANLDLSGVNSLLEKLDQAFVSLTKIESIAQAEDTRLATQTRALGELGIGSGNPLDPLNALNPRFLAAVSDVNQDTNFVLTDEQKERIKRAGDEAFSSVIESTVEALDEADKSKEELAESINEIIDSAVDRAPKDIIDTSVADEILAQKAALREEEAAAEDAADANEKLAEAIEKLGTARDRARDDALIKRDLALLDEETKASQQREKNIRAFNNKLRELEIDAKSDIDKKAVEIAQDAADKKIDIEKQYQDDLSAISRQVTDDLESASLDRDALTAFEILRNEQKARDDAKIRRDDALDKVDVERNRRERELSEQDSELQVKIDRERRFLKDRQAEVDIAASQRSDALEIQYQRELEQIGRNEVRKLADLETKYSEQIQLLEEYLNIEIDLRTATEEQITQLIEEQTQQRVAAIDAEIEARERLAAIQAERESGSRTRNQAGRDVSGGIGGIPEFHNGGIIPGPIGQEVVIRALAGEEVVPLGESPTTLPQSGGAGVNNVNRSLNIDNINLGGSSNPMDAFVTQAQLMRVLQSLRSRN